MVVVVTMIDRKYSQMHDNAQYGFDPHDDSDNLEIAHNTVWGNGNHGTREGYLSGLARCYHPT